jgi:hypothetical protein
MVGQTIIGFLYSVRRRCNLATSVYEYITTRLGKTVTCGLIKRHPNAAFNPLRYNIFFTDGAYLLLSL